MRFIGPSFDILTDISDGGIKELKHIERCGRVSYRSEDKITEDGESAKKFVAMLIRNGHESVLEHGSLTVEFTVDRAIANELVRHRMASFTQESTRYCNYSKDKFGGDLTYILPFYLKHGYDVYNRIMEEQKNDDEYKASVFWDRDNSISKKFFEMGSYIDQGFANGLASGADSVNKSIEDMSNSALTWWDDLCKFYNYRMAIDEATNHYLTTVTVPGYFSGMEGIVAESTPEEARFLLPLGLATKIVVTANYREWRHIFKLRCEKHAHPEMRRIMCSLWLVLNCKIPVIFDDIRELVTDYLNLDEIDTANDAISIARKYFEAPVKED